jgi:hypothetical protein
MYSHPLLYSLVLILDRMCNVFSFEAAPVSSLESIIFTNMLLHVWKNNVVRFSVNKSAYVDF